jgi:uncharacterized protein YecE (DUF72 family)
MTNWYLGTMGFSYKDWDGVFYPSGLNPRNYLTHYSRIFNAAELDTTFYGTPRAESVYHWASQTPEAFRFCAKFPQAITHDLGLAGVRDETAAFLKTMSLLEDKLGVLLLQFPPSFTVEKTPALVSFLAELPTDLRFAVEFRHRSWHTLETADLLSLYKVAWAATEFPGLPTTIHRTAPFLYIRWIGQHGSFERHTHERLDRSPELRSWWVQLQAHLEQVEAVYGFFNNDYAGFAAATCNKFKSMAGLPVLPFTPPHQGRMQI